MNPPSLSARKYPRQERSRQTVERILDAAAHIFNVHGFTASTTNDIADEAEVSIGSLYQYFPNKDAILVALTNRHIESSSSELLKLLSQLENLNNFDETIRLVVGFLVGQHELDELHLLIMHLAPRTHEINDELEKARNRIVVATSNVLASKFFDNKQHVLLARMVVATIDAGVHDVILRFPPGQDRQQAIELVVLTAQSIISQSEI